MSFYRNKKAEELNIENLPFWILLIIMMVGSAAIIYKGAESVVDVKLNTHDVEHLVWQERAIDALSFDVMGSVHRGIIDLDKFNDKTLAEALVLPAIPRSQRMVLRAVLTDTELVKQYEAYSDKELFDDAIIQVRLRYWQTTSTRYVLIKKGDELRKATLEITELFPKK